LQIRSFSYADVDRGRVIICGILIMFSLREKYSIIFRADKNNTYVEIIALN